MHLLFVQEYATFLSVQYVCAVFLFSEPTFAMKVALTEVRTCSCSSPDYPWRHDYTAQSYGTRKEIGRASGRERVSSPVWVSVVGVSFEHIYLFA